MKKLAFSLVLVFTVAACADSSNPHHNQALEKAIQECHKTSKGHKAVHNCLAERGFDIPKDHPPMHHHNPKLSKAMHECHSKLGSKDLAKFEVCLKEKGFEKPANHPPIYGHK